MREPRAERAVVTLHVAFHYSSINNYKPSTPITTPASSYLIGSWSPHSVKAANFEDKCTIFEFIAPEIGRNLNKNVVSGCK